MDEVSAAIARGAHQLVDRLGGPLNFRFVMMPTMVTLVAIRAGLRDVREGNPAFFWTVLTQPHERPRLLRSALKDIGRIFAIAVLMDTSYQLFVLGTVYVVQVLIVAVGCAVFPYILIRGPVTRWVRWRRRRRESPPG